MKSPRSSRTLWRVTRASAQTAFMVSFTASCMAGCASAPTSSGGGSADSAMQSQIHTLNTALSQLSARMSEMDTKLALLNDKFDGGKGTPLAAPAGTAKPGATHSAPTATQLVTPSAHKSVGQDPIPALAQGDPEAGFVNDSAVREYRKALLLYRGGKFPEAIQTFSAFLELHADHALAGSAQFYVADSYFQQKEYKLAVQEFQRVLTSYDRSSRMPDALRGLAEAEEQLKKDDDAQRHRQMLSSLFPMSPASSVKPDATVGTAKVPTGTEALSANPSIDEPPPPTAPAPDEKPATATAAAPASTTAPVSAPVPDEEEAQKED